MKAKCPKCGSDKIEVEHRYHNHSAFNGYRYTASDYSTVRCTNCQWPWRTKADYVGGLYDAKDKDV